MSKTIDIIVNTGSSIDTTKDLRKQISQLKKELFSLEEGTEQYNQTFEELSSKMLEFKDRNEALRTSARDLGEQLNNTVKVARGLASGFEVVQGTMALFGTESEAVEQVMIKLQAAIAIVQGLSGMEGLTKSIPALIASFGNVTKAVKGFTSGLSAMKAALIGTGIGAVAVALGAIIANWDKISSLWNADKSIENLKSDLDGLNNSLKDNESQLKTGQEAAYSQYRQALINAKGDVDAITVAEQKLKEALQGVSEEILRQNLSDALAAENKAFQDYIKSTTGWKSSFLSSEEKQALAAAYNEIKNTRIKAEQELQKYLEETELKKIQEENEANKIALENKKAAEVQYLNDLNAKLKALGLRGIGDDAFIHPKVFYDEAVMVLKQALDAKLITYEQYLIGLDGLNAKYGEGGMGFDSVLTDEQKEAFNASIESAWQDRLKIDTKNLAKIQTVNTKAAKEYTITEAEKWSRIQSYANTALSSVASAMEQNSVAQKGILIAQTIMNTAASAVAAARDTTGPVWLRVAAIATMLTAGGIQVANIIKTDPTGENGNMSDSTIPSLRTASQLPADIIGNTLSTQTEVDLQAENKNTRVYVLESDIANATNSVKTVVNESTF